MGICHSSQSTAVAAASTVRIVGDDDGGGFSPGVASTPRKGKTTSASTSTSSLYSKQGSKKKPNQDSAIVFEGYGGRHDATFFGVFDGHGRNGHLVSRLVRDRLPYLLLSERDAVLFPPPHDEEQHEDEDRNSSYCCYDDDDDSDSSDDEADCSTSAEMFEEWKEACVAAFRGMDKELKNGTGFDSSYSGTTAVTVVKQGKDLVISNLGDSRAVLGTLNEQGELVAVQLTTDLKPSLPHEAERIKKSNGRVFALRDEPSIQRVWLPDENYPGLAMARAFGDIELKKYGVIATPQVSYRKVHPGDQFLVLATDGVWDVLTNEQVVSIVWEAKSRQQASKAVVVAAVRAWKLMYPGSKVDDCSAVCVSLQEEYEDVEEEEEEGDQHEDRA